MFNTNDFINWTNELKNHNTEMNDFRSTHHNPMKQVNLHPIVESEEVQEISIVAPILTGLGRARASVVGKEVAKDAAITLGTKVARKALNKRKNRKDDGESYADESDTELEDEVRIRENTDLQEIGPLAVMGIGALGGAAVGTGMAMRKKQLASIEKRAQASADVYGGDTKRPYNFGDKRREAKALKKAKETAQTQAGGWEANQQTEGLIGTLAKGAVAGAAGYAAYKGVKALRNKWKEKTNAANVTAGEDAPTATSTSTQKAIEAGKAKVTSSLIDKARNNPVVRDVGAKAMKTASKGLGKASGWLATKAAGLAK